MIKVGQTTTNETITLPYELNNDGDTSISLNEIKGNTTQNGTPTPTSPQQVNVVKGKNILPVSTLTSRTKNGITFTNNGDGTYKLNGTATAYTDFTLINTLTLKRENTYVLNDTKITGLTMYVQKPGGVGVLDVQTYGTYTGEARTIILGIANRTILNDVIVKPYIYAGDFDGSSYSPYNTIQAKVIGKNLLDNTQGTTQTINGITFTKNSDGTLTANGTATAGVTYYVNGSDSRWQQIPPATYVLSDGTPSPSSSTYFTYLDIQRQDSLYLSTMSTKTRTYSSYYNCRARIVIRNGVTLNNLVFKVQLEQGTTATTYEAYKSNNYPITLGDIELCKIGNYQDRIYKNNGKWYLEKQVGKIASYNGETITTDFISTTGQKSTGATIYYVLATPTTTEITDDTLLEQLDAIGELYRGTNNIMITDTIAPVENIIIEKSNAEFDLVPYIKREPKIDYIDRKGDTGYTADGHYFENIIARKRAVEFELIPMSQDNYLSVISHFIDKTEIPVYIDDLFTGETNLINTWRKEKIPTKQITENGIVRGTTIKLEEI